MKIAGKKEGKRKYIGRLFLYLLICAVYGLSNVCQTAAAQIYPTAQISPGVKEDNLTENTESAENKETAGETESAERITGRKETEAAVQEESEEMQNELLGEMEFEEMQQMIEELLGENSFSVKDAVKDMINGEEPISKETVREFLRSLFFFGNGAGKGYFL